MRKNHEIRKVCHFYFGMGVYSLIFDGQDIVFSQQLVVYSDFDYNEIHFEESSGDDSKEEARSSTHYGIFTWLNVPKICSFLEF